MFHETHRMIWNDLTYLLPWMALDLREFEFGVVWIHLLNLISRRRSQYFNDLNQLIDTRVSGKDWLAQKQLG